MSLSNFELFEIAQKNNIVINDIVQKDQLVNIVPKKGHYIINLQDSTDGNGTHWTSLHLNKKLSLYFDSFAGPPPPDVVDFAIRFKAKELHYSNAIIQNLDSSNCGLYAITFFNMLDSGFTLMDYIKQFNSNTKQNDKIVKKLISK